MIQKMLIANWKMNPHTLAEAKTLAKDIKKESKGLGEMRLVVVPPFVFLSEVSKILKGSLISTGAQNVSDKKEGAQTGEISATMVEDAGATFVIIGHSERRAIGEGNEAVNKKVVSAIAAGLSVILCIGEQSRDEEGHYLEWLHEQIKSALKGLPPKAIKQLVIAYEPIWAIGNAAKRPVLASELHEISIFIRKTLLGLYGKVGAYKVPIIYGGSVDQNDAANLLSNGAIDGFLVGRASLDAKVFGEIIKITKSSGAPKIVRV
jgi:triosephosphate isomerase